MARPRLLTWALVAAGLAAGSLVSRQLPTTEDVLDQPFRHEAKIGDTVTLRNYRVTLEKVEPAKKLASGLSTFESQNGIYVVATLVFEATRETTALGTMSALAKDGRVFGGPQPSGMRCAPSQPLLKVRCQQVVEVAGDALEGLSLQLAAQPIVQTAGDDLAIFDLGLDRGRAAEWATTSASIKPADPEATR